MYMLSTEFIRKFPDFFKNAVLIWPTYKLSLGETKHSWNICMNFR